MPRTCPICGEEVATQEELESAGNDALPKADAPLPEEIRPDKRKRTLKMSYATDEGSIL
jgi:hypothetical protein